MATSMKWAGVTCLNSVCSSERTLASLPPYLALTIFHVPTSLFSVIASTFFEWSAVERPDVKAATATRDTRTAIEIRLIRRIRLNRVVNISITLPPGFYGGLQNSVRCGAVFFIALPLALLQPEKPAQKL